MKRRQFYHTVAKGQTLYEIANLYHMALPDIQSYNPGIDGTRLAVDSRVTVFEAQSPLTVRGKVERLVTPTGATDPEVRHTTYENGRLFSETVISDIGK